MSEGNLPWGQLSSGAIARGQLSGGQSSRRQLSGGQLSGGQFSLGAIVPEPFLKPLVKYENYENQFSEFFSTVKDLTIEFVLMLD